MPFSLRCDQYMVTGILQDQQYMFVHGRESVVDEEEPGRRVVQTTNAAMQSQRSILSCGQTGV